MRLTEIIFPFSIILLLLGCTNSKDNKSSTSDNVITELTKVDTLVNSFPLNDIKATDAADSSKVLEIGSYKEILELFEKFNYTPEAWQSGIREVPRVYLITMGKRWGATTSKEITVIHKKQLFFRGLAPLILHSNELIMMDRNRLEKIRASLQGNIVISEWDQIWMLKLAKFYEVKTDEEQSAASIVEELWQRVDIIPAALALSQTAIESGWGTSRFAASGNALYGQWTWGEDAMIPEEQRKGLGNYGVAAFGSLQESVCSYMLNLNTHYAYADLRTKREELRRNGEKITGYVLADQLIRYSERGETYVNELKSMMDYNHLNPVDDAYLSNDSIIFLIPAAN